MNWNDLIIGQNTNINGNLKTIANVSLSGQINGTLFSDKDVLVKEPGLIKGEVECIEFALEGTVEGNVKAKKIYLKPAGKMLGNITASLLKVDEGAAFIGCSKKIDQDKDSKLKNTDPIYEI